MTDNDAAPSTTTGATHARPEDIPDWLRSWWSSCWAQPGWEDCTTLLDPARVIVNRDSGEIRTMPFDRPPATAQE